MEPNTSASVHAPDHNMPQLQQAPPPQDSHLVPPTGIINVKPRRLPDLNASPPPDDDEEVQDLRYEKSKLALLALHYENICGGLFVVLVLFWLLHFLVKWIVRYIVIRGWMHLLDKVTKYNKDTTSAIASDHNQPPILQQAPRPQVPSPCINVESRLLIDINASPPRDDDDDDEEEVQNLRMHAPDNIRQNKKEPTTSASFIASEHNQPLLQQVPQPQVSPLVPTPPCINVDSKQLMDIDATSSSDNKKEDEAHDLRMHAPDKVEQTEPTASASVISSDHNQPLLQQAPRPQVSPLVPPPCVNVDSKQLMDINATPSPDNKKEDEAHDLRMHKSGEVEEKEPTASASLIASDYNQPLLQQAPQPQDSPLVPPPCINVDSEQLLDIDATPSPDNKKEDEAHDLRMHAPGKVEEKEPTASAFVIAFDHNQPLLQQAPQPQDSPLLVPPPCINVDSKQLMDIDVTPSSDNKKEDEAHGLRMNAPGKVEEKEPTASAFVIDSDHNQPLLQQAPQPQDSPLVPLPCINVESKQLSEINEGYSK
ncbi:hypothetical protein RIF29_18775 [Crotalaria pallida]|uniref:Uncharacterized protein n=1 Tax=Crotalaria pallida TaxID=3830 RepID=A0AAN9F0J6_CROPI